MLRQLKGVADLLDRCADAIKELLEVGATAPEVAEAQKMAHDLREEEAADDFKKVEGHGLELPLCPVCGGATEMWERFNQFTGNTTKAVMCTTDSDADERMPAGCPMYLPPTSHYAATHREAAELFRKFSVALVAKRRQSLSELLEEACGVTKRAAAVRTLEALGYTYAVSGAELWKPPLGGPRITFDAGVLPREAWQVVLDAVNKAATGFDKYEYGLPMGTPSAVGQMTVAADGALRAWADKNGSLG